MRKTIVIVTHDIDEAVKLADKVAIMNVGGVLEQYATPDELLSAPANEFVASFLGRERGLRAPRAAHRRRHRADHRTARSVRRPRIGRGARR